MHRKTKLLSFMLVLNFFLISHNTFKLIKTAKYTAAINNYMACNLERNILRSGYMNMPSYNQIEDMMDEKSIIIKLTKEYSVPIYKVMREKTKQGDALFNVKIGEQIKTINLGYIEPSEMKEEYKYYPYMTEVFHKAYCGVEIIDGKYILKTDWVNDLNEISSFKYYIEDYVPTKEIEKQSLIKHI